MQTVKGMLDNPNEPVSDLSYFDCIESVMENSKVSLAVLLASLSTVGKNRDMLRVPRSVAPPPRESPCLKRLVVPLPRCFSNQALHRSHLGGLVEHRLLGHTHTPKFLIPYIPEWARLGISDQFPGQALWSRIHTLRTTAYALSGMSLIVNLSMYVHHLGLHAGSSLSMTVYETLLCVPVIIHLWHTFSSGMKICGGFGGASSENI